MARMKIEFLHAYGERHGLTLRQRLIAYLPRYAPVASRVGALLNLRNAVPGLPLLGEKLFGLSRRRALPAWAARPFSGHSRSGDAHQGGKQVVLWVDTFSRYFEPENARAALDVLDAAGYRVEIAAPAEGGRPLCCGRTFLAAGQVDKARAEAVRLLEALRPWVERGIPIIGLEPSCLFTLRDEYLVMGLGAETGPLAERAMLMEEFLASEAQSGSLALALRPLRSRRALLHGHCHQKAFDVMPSVRKVLGLIPDLEVESVESSCCGMAGNFGYEAEHFDISMKMAEASLLPAVRKAGPETLIVADGTSCRHQIRDGAKREALHVVRVLKMALKEPQE
jgi:Fe-S oxidoreductase